MADTEIRVEVRTEGAECIARIVRPDTGEVLGEVGRCTVSAFRTPEVVEAWKAFVKAATACIIEAAIADRGGRITGWAEAGPGESVPGHTIPPSERN